MISFYLTTWWNAFFETAAHLWSGIAVSLAPVLGAALILLIGWFFAFFAGKLVKRILGQDNINWEKTLSGIKLAQVFEERLGLSTDVGAFLGWLVRWFLITVTFVAASQVLGLHAVSAFLGQLVGFVPTAVTAALIVFLGFFVAKFIDQVITRWIGAVGVNASVGGTVARWLLIAFSVLAAARYLNLQLDVLWPRFVDFLVWAGAIAVGFGFSSRAGEWLEKIKGRLQ